MSLSHRHLEEKKESKDLTVEIKKESKASESKINFDKILDSITAKEKTTAESKLAKPILNNSIFQNLLIKAIHEENLALICVLWHYEVKLPSGSEWFKEAFNLGKYYSLSLLLELGCSDFKNFDYAAVFREILISYSSKPELRSALLKKMIATCPRKAGGRSVLFTTEWHERAFLGEVEKLENIAECDLTLKDPLNLTPLLYACCGGSIPAIEFLIQKMQTLQINLNQIGCEKHNPVSLSVLHNHESVLKKLVQQKFSLFERYQNDSTILHFANSLSMIAYLVKMGIDMNAHDKFGNNCLISYCSNQYLPNHFPEIAQFFIETNKFDINHCNKKNKSLLFILINRLVKENFDLTARETKNTIKTLIKLLVQHSASQKNRKGKLLLHQLIRNNSLSVYEIDFIFNFKLPGASKLFFNINEQNANGNSLLHHAAFNRLRLTRQQFELLKNYGADPAIVNAKGLTPLELAIQRGNHGFIHDLLTVYPQNTAKIAYLDFAFSVKKNPELQLLITLFKTKKLQSWVQDSVNKSKVSWLQNGFRSSDANSIMLGLLEDANNKSYKVNNKHYSQAREMPLAKLYLAKIYISKALFVMENNEEKEIKQSSTPDYRLAAKYFMLALNNLNKCAWDLENFDQNEVASELLNMACEVHRIVKNNSIVKPTTSPDEKYMNEFVTSKKDELFWPFLPAALNSFCFPRKSILNMDQCCKLVELLTDIAWPKALDTTQDKLQENLQLAQDYLDHIEFKLITFILWQMNLGDIAKSAENLYASEVRWEEIGKQVIQKLSVRYDFIASKNSKQDLYSTVIEVAKYLEMESGDIILYPRIKEYEEQIMTMQECIDKKSAQKNSLSLMGNMSQLNIQNMKPGILLWNLPSASMLDIPEMQLEPEINKEPRDCEHCIIL